MGLMNTRIFGVDPSPRGTAVAYLEGGVLQQVWFCTEAKITAKKWDDALLLPKVKLFDDQARMDRLNLIGSWFRDLLHVLSPEYVAIEDYIVGHSGASNRHSGASNRDGMMGKMAMGELGGLLRLAVLKAGAKLRTYDVQGVKISWVDHGGADKNMMMEEGEQDVEIQALGLTKTNKTTFNNIVDAVAIARFLWAEIQVRSGEVMVKDLPKRLIRAFNRPSGSWSCLLDRPFASFER